MCIQGTFDSSVVAVPTPMSSRMGNHLARQADGYPSRREGIMAGSPSRAIYAAARSRIAATAYTHVNPHEQLRSRIGRAGWPCTTRAAPGMVRW
jgi:hypothetical protein